MYGDTIAFGGYSSDSGSHLLMNRRQREIAPLMQPLRLVLLYLLVLPRSQTLAGNRCRELLVF